MHNTIAHHPLTDVQLVLKHQWESPTQLLQADILGTIFYITAYPFG